MSYFKIQGKTEKARGVYYQVDTDAVPIGYGGMGQVFKGTCVDEHTGATRPVAIKFMYADVSPQAIAHAQREASIQLRNDNLVEMLGFIELDERTVTGEVVKHYHVVSELLTGVSLADVLEGKTTDRDGNEVPFAVQMLQEYRNDSEYFARKIVTNVLSGLMALHDAGYIHRDIDPSNIMLTTDGHIKLLDFGIAKQMNAPVTYDKKYTVEGKFIGKPEYAAPELALGDIEHHDQTTDIYAVGILLYQCIVGHTPFEGAHHEILEKQLNAKIPLAAIKNKALRKIIAKACEKKQELRYQSAAQMRADLDNLGSSAQSPLSKLSLSELSATAKMAIASVAGLLLGVLIHVLIP
ncbi:MAG: serine/threonine protein kinase [Prevotella sp.]|nr:serine/threonine protein kinase [Prevotella sp.]